MYSGHLLTLKGIKMALKGCFKIFNENENLSNSTALFLPFNDVGVHVMKKNMISESTVGMKWL